MKDPEVFQNDIWSPICGHWFWDNDVGASLFCQKFTSDPTSTGYVIRRTDKPLEKDAIRIGNCLSNDQWLSCSGGCNDLGTGLGDTNCADPYYCGANSPWCDKIYPNSNYGGWEQVITGTNMLEMIGNDNNVVSSVRVHPGCTLKLFNEHNNVGLLDSLTTDVSFYNDQVSSLSCTCKGMITTHLEPYLMPY